MFSKKENGSIRAISGCRSDGARLPTPGFILASSPPPPPPDLLPTSSNPPPQSYSNTPTLSIRQSRRNSRTHVAALDRSPCSVMIPNAGSDLWTDLHHHGGGLGGGDHSRDRCLEEASVSPPDFHRHSSSLTSASTGAECLD